jgi:hypothetical protein
MKFGINPKKMQICKKHRSMPIEFVCNISEEFYCRMCGPSHEGHDDHSMSVHANEVQKSITTLKHLYLTKRTHVIDRLNDH